MTIRIPPALAAPLLALALDSAGELAAVKAPSNCAACHPRAKPGEFNEHRVRIPG